MGHRSTVAASVLLGLAVLLVCSTAHGAHLKTHSGDQGNFLTDGFRSGIKAFKDNYNANCNVHDEATTCFKAPGGKCKWCDSMEKKEKSFCFDHEKEGDKAEKCTGHKGTVHFMQNRECHHHAHVKSCLKQVAGPDTNDAEGKTPLHCEFCALVKKEGELSPCGLPTDEVRSKCAIGEFQAVFQGGVANVDKDYEKFKTELGSLKSDGSCRIQGQVWPTEVFKGTKELKEARRALATAVHEKYAAGKSGHDLVQAREKCLDCGLTWCIQAYHDSTGKISAVPDDKLTIVDDEKAGKRNYCVAFKEDCGGERRTGGKAAISHVVSNEKKNASEEEESSSFSLTGAVSGALSSLTNSVADAWNDFKEEWVSGDVSEMIAERCKIIDKACKKLDTCGSQLLMLPSGGDSGSNDREAPAAEEPAAEAEAEAPSPVVAEAAAEHIAEELAHEEHEPPAVVEVEKQCHALLPKENGVDKCNQFMNALTAIKGEVFLRITEHKCVRQEAKTLADKPDIEISWDFVEHGCEPADVEARKGVIIPKCSAEEAEAEADKCEFVGSEDGQKVWEAFKCELEQMKDKQVVTDYCAKFSDASPAAAAGAGAAEEAPGAPGSGGGEAADEKAM